MKKAKKLETCKPDVTQQPAVPATIKLSLACPACGKQSHFLINTVVEQEPSVPTVSHDANSAKPSDMASADEGLIVQLNVEAAEPRTGSISETFSQFKSGPISLSGLLAALYESADLDNMNGTITIPDKGEHAIEGFFQSFTDVNALTVGSYHGFWGQISTTSLKGESLWLNTGGPATLSVLLDMSYADEVFRRFNIKGADEIIGARLLVLGELKSSKNGKRYVQITESTRFIMKLNQVRSPQ